MVLLVSPAAKLTVPLGRPLLVPRASWLPTKSAVVSPAEALRAQVTLPLPLVSPLRVTVNTTGVVPLPPSAMLAGALSTKLVSSLLMTVLAVDVPRVVLADGLLRVRVKVSLLASATVSPLTLKVTASSLTPTPKLRVPVGSTPPATSAVLAPLLPVTA